MLELTKIFSGDKNKAALSKDEVAKLLGTTPAALAAFEESYRKHILSTEPDGSNFFDVNAKQAAAMRTAEEITAVAKELNDRIIAELLAQTYMMTYDGAELTTRKLEPGGQPTVEKSGLPAVVENQPVTNGDIQRLPKPLRPQLSGNLMKRDMPGKSSDMLLFLYKKYLEEKNPGKKQMFYRQFRWGLDTLDLDGLTYEMLGTNPNNMGYWLPELIESVKKQDFFKVPKTQIMKVPMTLLQLSRIDYGELTSSTMDVVDRFCFQAFGLDESKNYFIKTGTYSSKYDFRNAKVAGAKEVRELGEYLLFIQHQAAMMASPLATPRFYGVSTTNEWVVREFIEDVEGNPSIYKGLPLHTEYRVFVDFDDGAVLGMNPYWDPEVMKQRFGHENDADSPHQIHDYIIYRSHEETLMKRYNENAEHIWRGIEVMLPDVNLPSQWSIDVMQNGDDFYIIDMALAENSALRRCVPQGLLKHAPENWLPRLPEPA
jgi:predicted transcriptional regulator